MVYSIKKIQLFDAHLHIINKTFPVTENMGYTPEAFTVEQYLEKMQDYRLTGGAIALGRFKALVKAI